MSARDLSDLPMLDLFRLEAETQVQTLIENLLLLERAPMAAEPLEASMRAAHSLKGAARIVGLNAGVGVAHAMEDCLVAAQRGRITVQQGQIDLLLRGADLLTRITKTPEANLDQWSGENSAEVSKFLEALSAAIKDGNGAAADDDPLLEATPVAPAVPSMPQRDLEPTAAADEAESSDRVLRVTAENLNRLLGLAGESLVESRWLKPFAESLLRLKRLHYNLGKDLEVLREVPSQLRDERGQKALAGVQQTFLECQRLLSDRLVELELFDGRSTNLAHRLYEEASACRMRPFGDGVQSFPHMVRDLGRSLGK